MQRDTVISVESKRDSILLENEFECSAYITIGLADKGDFYVKLEFADLDANLFDNLLKLSVAPKEIKISSEVINNHNYNITHIVVESFSSSSNKELTWECISDTPGLSLIIE